MNKTSREEFWKLLNEIAPLKLAGSWDNVGILLDPLVSQPKKVNQEKVLLTIDLTESVFEEAIAGNFTIIIAYHPIIFGGVKRLTQSDSQSRILLRAAQSEISIYSPHTALDAVQKGVCDWLAATIIHPLEQQLSLNSLHHLVEHCEQYQAIEQNPMNELEGAGRLLRLRKPLSLSQICQRLHHRLNMGLSSSQNPVYLRTVRPQKMEQDKLNIRSIALCPGAGGSLFENLQDVDLLITGEMRHHDLLHKSAHGTAVVLTEHSRCERGYLPLYAEWLKQIIGCEVYCATTDDDPLTLFI